jgi:hypothetical protein
MLDTQVDENEHASADAMTVVDVIFRELRQGFLTWECWRLVKLGCNSDVRAMEIGV